MQCLANNTAFIRTKKALAILVTSLALGTTSQGATQTNLDKYVEIGVKQNLALQQERFILSQSQEAAREMFGLLLPSLTLNSRYSDFSRQRLDLGDLINPAYAALNRVTGGNQFPTNLSFKIPYRQETSIRLLQPIVLPKAYFGYRARRNLAHAESAKLETVTRDKIAEIKTAYFNYAKALRAVELYDHTLELLGENLRVSQKLVDNQKVTLDVLYRAKADLSDIQQKRAEAERQKSDATRYFNFLLNRPSGDPIELNPDSLSYVYPLPSVDSLIRTAQGNRPEMRQIESGIAASENNARLNCSAFLPTVALAVDYGYQGESYRFESRSDQTTVSLVASWNLFNGGQDRSRHEQAVLETKRLTLQRSELLRQIELQILQAHDAVLVAQQARLTAHDRLESAHRSFDLVSRKFAEGMASQVEYLDARTNFTSAGINEILTNYDYVQKYVQLERVAALAAVPSEFNTNR